MTVTNTDADDAQHMTNSRRRTVRSGVILLAIAFTWRLAILLQTDFATDGDEGTVGLMAFNIARLIDFPVFFYGQPYMGTIEAYAAALPMAVFGASAVALKLTGLVFALLTVLFGWLLARRVLGPVAGFATGLYLAVPPFYLSVWSLKMRGGYTSLLALGAGILLLAHVIATNGASKRNSFGFGLLVGLASYLTPLAFPLVGAAALFLLARRVIVNRVAFLVSMTLGFLLGAAPLIIPNILSGGETLRFLTQRGGVGQGLSDLSFTLTDSLPKLLGVTVAPDTGSTHFVWARPVIWLFVLGLLVLVWRERQSLLKFLRFSGKTTSGAEMFLMVGLLYLFCAVVSKRFGSVPSPRFSVVLIFTIAPAFGCLFAWGWERRGLVPRGAASLLLTLLISFNVYSLWHYFDGRTGPYTAISYYPFVYGSRSTNYLEKLRELGVDGLASDHFVRHSMNFLSGDEIVPSPPRFEGHVERFRQAEHIAWSTSPMNRDSRVVGYYLDNLAKIGVTIDEHLVDGQRIALLQDTGHSTREWRARGSVRPKTAVAAIDRDPRSYWTAEAPPRGQPPTLTIDLGRVVAISRIGFLFYLAREQHAPLVPTRLRLRVAGPDRVWRDAKELVPTGAVWGTRIPPTRARYVQLTATDHKAWWLAELFLDDK